MKKLFILSLCLAISLFCMVNTNAEFVETPKESENTENIVEIPPEVEDLYSKYELITEEEYNFLSTNLYEETSLDFLLTLLARVHYTHNISMQTIYDVPEDSVAYCIENDIFDDGLDNYTVPLTRGAFAHLIINTVDGMPFANMEEINTIYAEFIPDVEYDYFYADDVYRCYEYGLMLGMDETYAFYHETPVNNHQVVVVLNRLMNPELRETI